MQPKAEFQWKGPNQYFLSFEFFKSDFDFI